MRWKDELKNNICTIEQLKGYIQMSPKQEKRLRKIIERHPMSITRYYLSLIDWDNPDDPIRRMVIPTEDELNLSGSYDTSGEHENTKMPGLQHKYPQTVLILSTNRCSAYCRYCFRKRLVGLSSEEILHRFSKAANYIEKHTEVNNVLVSGGDPFHLSTRILTKFIERLSRISHLDFIRFGSKTPVTFPHRILEDKKLLTLFKRNSLKDKRIYVVTQFNHPGEITDISKDAIDSLLVSGVVVNNQSVLLRGVNDDPDILSLLQRKLVSIGVNPYYVFQCRPVKRVKHHFQVPLHHGYEIVEQARKKLDGHSKRFKYIIAHKTGKIEIIAIKGNEIYFKQHQAKDPEKIGKFFKRRLNRTAGWFDDLN